MDTNEVFAQYMDIVRKNPEKAYQDFLKTRNAVANSTAQYKGEPVPFLYQPMFVTDSDIDNFERLSAALTAILNKVIERYIHFPEYRRKFGYPKLLEELILLDHGYHMNFPMARFDIFYGEDGSFKFCELNADGSSGMNETNEIERIFLQSQSIVEMAKEYEISYFELLNKWVDESLTIYQAYSGSTQKPNVAIVDWDGLATAVEFEAFKNAYIKQGSQAVVIDPRKLKYHNGKLFAGDMQIDLVYRRLVTFELVERSDEIADFIRAYKDGAVCVAGPVRSQIIHNKIIFKILHDPDTKAFLTDEENEYVKEHIPYTGEFSGDQGRYEECLRHKDRYVLKPKDLYASKGVYVGSDMGVQEWAQKVKECWNNDYLFQEFCIPAEKEMVHFKDGKLVIEPYKHIIGLYMYNGKFAGMYTRVSKHNTIASAHGCYNLPNLYVKAKK